MLQQQLDEAIDRNSMSLLLQTIELESQNQGQSQSQSHCLRQPSLMYNAKARPGRDGSKSNLRSYYDKPPTTDTSIVKAKKETTTSTATTINDAICKAVEGYRDRVRT